jgi:hypothetical protein
VAHLSAMGKKPRTAGERADHEPEAAPGVVSGPPEPSPDAGDETARRLVRLARLQRRLETARRLVRLARLQRRLDDARVLEERRRRQVTAACARVARLVRLARLQRRLDDARVLEERRRRQVTAACARVARLEVKLGALGAAASAAVAGAPARSPDEDDSRDFMRFVAREAAEAIRDSSAGDNSPTTRVGARRAAHARTMARRNSRRPPST